MMAFLRGIPQDSDENFAHWLARHGQTKRAIERFWKPVLVSALNEDLDRVSVHYAAMVFRSAFMQSAQGGSMGVPTIPLSELYGHALEYIESHGGTVTLRKSVTAIQQDGTGRRWQIQLDDGSIEADAVVLALPFESMTKLLPGLPPTPNGYSNRLAQQLEHFEHSPITGIHLWFDRPITSLEHAVLLDTTIQWMYNKSLLQPETRASGSEKLSRTGGERIEVARGKIPRGNYRTGIARAGGIFSGCTGSKTAEGSGGERGARNIFRYAWSGCVSSRSGNRVAGDFSCR